MKNKYFVLALASLAFLTILFWGLKENFGTQIGSTSQVQEFVGTEPSSQVAFSIDHSLLVRAHSPVLGPSSATVTIVEFLDPECEACRAMYPITKKVMAEFPNKVKLVIRYMPFHPNSLYAANILEESRQQGKYWETLELVFKRQPEWADHHDPRPERILTFLKDLNLDIGKIEMAIREGKYTAQIKKDEVDGKALGVQATPTFFVNGKVLEDLGEEALKRAIAAELK